MLQFGGPVGEDALRCKRIIDDLRDFSRRHELAVASADLNTLVHDALQATARSGRLQGITVATELARGIPPVPCDAARMEQVLANVLSNAAQCMPQGGILTVGTALRAGYAEISVADTGPGIPRAIRNRVFDPFFTTKPEGTGLGLSIVHTIMTAHGGRVEIDSVTREDHEVSPSRPMGTRVALLLPLAGGRGEQSLPAAGATGG